MSAPIAIRVVDLVGPICVSTDDGQRIYDTIAPLLRTGRPVALSFAGITTVIAAFLTSPSGSSTASSPTRTSGPTSQCPTLRAGHRPPAPGRRERQGLLRRPHAVRSGMGRRDER